MEDKDVIEALVRGERAFYGPNLHIEGDVMFAFGWFHLGFRLSPSAFMIRNDDGDDELPLIALMEEVLGEHDLVKVMDDHPLVQAISYTEMSLAGPTWAIWATDKARGEAAVVARAGADSIPRGLMDSDMANVGDFSAELEGARRIAGLPPSVILALGLDQQQIRTLQVVLPECRFEQRAFGEIRPESCSDVTPALAIINCTEQQGKNFLMELRAVACGRFIPIAAVSDDLPLGADVAFAPGSSPSGWKDDLVKLLP